MRLLFATSVGLEPRAELLPVRVRELGNTASHDVISGINMDANGLDHCTYQRNDTLF